MNSNTSCDSPFVDDLPPLFIAYKVTICLVFLTAAAGTLMYWKLTINTSSAVITRKSIFIPGIQAICCIFYAGFNLIFILRDVSPLTSCTATVVFSSLVHAIPFPTIAQLFQIIKKSQLNELFMQFYEADQYFSNKLSANLNSTSIGASSEKILKKLQRLKFLSSEKVFYMSLFVEFFLILTATIFMQQVICGSLFTGKSCQLEQIGFRILFPYYLFFSIQGFILTFLVTKRYTKYLIVHKLQGFWQKLQIYVCVTNFLHTEEDFDLLYLFTIPLDLSILSCYILQSFYLLYINRNGSKGNNLSQSDGISLEDILRNKTAKNLFRTFLIESLCSENLAFIEHVELFKVKYDGMKFKEAQFIVYNFIAPRSLAEINISHKTRKNIMKKFRNDNIQRDLFDIAEAEVLQLLSFDSLSKFKNSEYYLHAVVSF
eukprot:snap_masked-scaffold_2-processed-gene-22.22-mRNA-1 protein AED:1.00 eAED:1.00 QI:0/0/0/0/1/1/2/0/429